MTHLSTLVKNHPQLAWPWRILRAAVLALLATALLFLLVQALPGDAATSFAGVKDHAAVSDLRAQMGLDRPVWQRYFAWLINFLRGDLGTTLVSGQKVSSVIGLPLLSTLTVTAIVFAGILFITLPLSLYFSYRGAKGGQMGRAFSGISLALAAVPEFIIAIFLLALLSQTLKWLPVLAVPGPGQTVWHKPITLVLPVLTLWLLCSAPLFRRMHALISVHTKKSYVREAELAGLTQGKVLFGHLLPSALNGITQLLAQTFPYLLGGAVVVENVCSFQGLGSSLLLAVSHRETPIVMAIGAFLIATSALAYTLADVMAHKGTSVEQETR